MTVRISEEATLQALANHVGPFKHFMVGRNEAARGYLYTKLKAYWFAVYCTPPRKMDWFDLFEFKSYNSPPRPMHLHDLKLMRGRRT